VVSAGPLETALTPETLTAAFDLPLSLTRDGDRFAARAL
jgi:iron complex transport system ATP-binding protein